MACCGQQNTFSSTVTTISNTRTTSTNESTIAALLKRIDQIQRSAITQNALGNCDNCMVNVMYNTKPINIYCGCTQFVVTFGGVEYTLFRVEEVRGVDTVVLRLLDTTGEEVVCTGETFVLRIDCICGIKCNPPLNCTLSCFQNNGTM